MNNVINLEEERIKREIKKKVNKQTQYFAIDDLMTSIEKLQNELRRRK